MKKILTILLSSVVISFTAIFSSCSSSSSSSTPDSVMEKIDSSEQLEITDYETMLDYIEEFVEMGERSDGSYESGQEAARRYPYFMTFANQMEYAPDEVQNSQHFQDVMIRYVIMMSR